MGKLKLGVDVGENDAEPRQFLECALLAEAEGFDSVWLETISCLGFTPEAGRSSFGPF